MLALQRGAGNAAVSRLLARAPAPRAVEQPGHEEAGWARPSTTMSDEPVHVATIHFRTKEWSIDSVDEALLKGLAMAYAPYAGRNRFKPKEPQGLRGRVIGYADPRPSAAPDNRELSSKRAEWTAHYLLRHLVRESGVIHGAFDVERVAGGVAPEAPAGPGAAKDEPVAEGNLLAPGRRADVYLAGQATEPQPSAPKQPEPEPEDKRVKPPDLDDWNTDEWQYSDWGKFDKPIEEGNKDDINAMAARMMGVLATQGSDWDAMLFWLHQVAGVTGHDIPKVVLQKPPWWDNRDSGIYPRVGRGGMSAPQKLTYKAKLLKRDYIESMKWAEMHVTSPRSSLKQMIDEVKKSNPDQAKLREWAQALGYLRFMLNETQNLCEEVLKMTR